MANYDYIDNEQTVGKYRALVAGETEGGWYCNPREDRDTNICHMIFFGSITRHYSLGDEQLTGDYWEPVIECPACDGSGEASTYEVHTSQYFRTATPVGDGFDTEAEAEEWAEHLRLDEGRSIYVELTECPRCEGSGEVTVSIEEWALSYHDGLIAVPLRAEDYGSNGVKVYTAPYSDDPNGVAICRDTDLLKGWGHYVRNESGKGGRYVDPNEHPELTDRKVDWYDVLRQVPGWIESEVREYDEWGRGEVYFWAVEDEDGEVLDTVAGFIGDEGAKYAMTEAISHAEYLIREDAVEAERAAEAAARDIVTVGS